MTDTTTNLTDMSRYHRQIILPGIGDAGQARLSSAHALVVGCGALGSVIIDALARAGVGRLTIIDRDIVESTNLQRQLLYTESDAIDGIPKAAAAARAVAAINRQVKVDARIEHFDAASARALTGDIDIVLDGLDSFETRYLLNDLAVSRDIPYVYGGAVATSGTSFTILPGDGPCLRCLFPDAPPPGTTATCDTAGVLGPIVTMIGARQAAEAIKVLAAGRDVSDRQLLSIDIWSGMHRTIDVSGARRGDCPACGQRDFTWLNATHDSDHVSLCGQDAIQLVPARPLTDLDGLATRLDAIAEVTRTPFLIRAALNDVVGIDDQPIHVTIFPGGRTVIRHARDVNQARSIMTRLLGG